MLLRGARGERGMEPFYHYLESCGTSFFWNTMKKKVKWVFVPSCYSCHVTLVVDFVSSPLFSKAHFDHSSYYNLSTPNPRLTILHMPLSTNDFNYMWIHSCAHTPYLSFVKYIYMWHFTFRGTFQNVFNKNLNTYFSVHSLTVHSQ